MKILHTMIRVADLEPSIRFYRDVMRMKEQNRIEHEEGRFTLVFLGYSEDGPTVELTYNWGNTKAYDMGNGFGHLAIAVDDIHDFCAAIKAKGVKVTVEPKAFQAGDHEATLAFIEDPDGYAIELIQV